MVSPSVDADPRAGRRDERHLPGAKLIVFALLPALILIGAAELVIRMLRADETCTTPILADSPIWECDPLLHIRTRRSLVVDGRRVNAFGFRAPELTAKAPGVLRVVTLGDSCTFGMIARSDARSMYIAAPYADVLQRSLDAAGRSAEVLNAGTCGYSSYQGVMLLRTKLRDVDADVITARFGWNDAMAGGVVRSVDLREPETAFGRTIESLLLRTALFRFGKRLSTTLHAPPPRPAGTLPEAPSEWTPVIPLEDYKRNLRRIVEEGRRQGGRVWLLTEPIAFVTDEYRGREATLGETSAGGQLFLLLFSGIKSFAQLVAINADYNAAVREVAAETGATLVDMVAVYEAHASEHLFDAADVIHPNERGHEIEAEALFAELRKEGLVAQ